MLIRWLTRIVRSSVREEVSFLRDELTLMRYAIENGLAAANCTEAESLALRSESARIALGVDRLEKLLEPKATRLRSRPTMAGWEDVERENAQREFEEQ